MIHLTFRQGEVLKFMYDFYLENDQLPTMQAMADQFGWASANNSVEHCQMLFKKGALERNALDKYKFSRSAKLFFYGAPGVLCINEVGAFESIKEQIKRIRGQV
jgi:SOS-response transcriptional repressor LexA